MRAAAGGAARQGARGRSGWHANRVYTIGHPPCRAVRSASSTAAPSSRSMARRRRAPSSTGCARTRAAPAPRKAATKATAVPARSSSASSRAAGAASDDVACGLRLRSANACIQFLPTLDGKALFTVEDLQGADGTLHPVQQAMVACHGSQCGFCTPGFVMSLWAAYQHHGARGTRPSRQQIADELSGNLCRCTGYRPIVDAGERMFDLPAAPLDAAPVVAALTSLRDAAPLSSIGANGAEFIAPRTLDDFAAAAARPARRAHPRRLDRHRPVGQQDVPRPAAPRLHRRGRRAEADRRARRRAVDRRRGVARGRVARAGRALAEPGRGLAALRRRAAAPHRDDGRQRRQRLADRRLGAGADGARCVARPAPRRSDAGASASPTSTPAT